MHKLSNTDFVGTLTMDTDGDVVNIWLEDNEQRIFRQHFNKDFADEIYQQTPPADLADFIAGFSRRSGACFLPSTKNKRTPSPPRTSPARSPLHWAVWV